LKAKLPNGAVSTYEYDNAGQLLSLLHFKGGQGMTLFSSRYDYLYDEVGNRRVATETLFTPHRIHFPVVMKSEDGDGQGMMAAPGTVESLSSGSLAVPYPAPEGETPLDVPGVLTPLATPLPVEEAYPLPVPASELPAMDSLDSAYPAPVDGAEGSGTSFWQGIIAFFSNLFSWITPASTAHAAPAQAGSAAPVQTQALSSEGERQVVITYTYDLLNRLTAADYSDGPYFHYTYDSAGNRLTQTVPTGTTTYSYDHANRLSNAGGVTYAWDNNGNLLWDGVYTYTYSSANRLVTVAGWQSPAVSYTYSGLGDRVRQTAGGVTTNYAIDLAGGLTQVLADGQHAYLYGNGRIAQYSAGGADYFLGDALGSVRQLVDGNGNVTLTKNYQPYGELMDNAGSGVTSYGYTGEMVDPNGLVYLRARYYASGQGRFISRDVWDGDDSTPISYNRWLYGFANPLRFTDPTGHIPACDLDDWACQYHWDYPITPDNNNKYTVQTGLSREEIDTIYKVTELVAPIVYEPIDWMMTYEDCSQGKYSPFMLLGLLPLIPSSAGRYADDIVQLVPAKTLYFSQKHVSAVTRHGPVMYLDDLAQDMAQGWKGSPLRVLEIDGKLVSLDNRRLTIAKMLDIDVPVTITRGFTVNDLKGRFGRDGIFTQISIRGADLIIDMLGRLIGR
jgi:RHS repeat-associated protein